MIKLCPTCNTQFKQNEEFCPNDGTKLVSQNVDSSTIGFGDNAIVTGDLNISVNNENAAIDNEFKGKTDSVSFGDKAIVSGDIKVESTTNIENLTIHKDDTKKLLKCSISGEDLDYQNRFTCISCSNVYALRFKSSSEQCNNCTKKQEEDNEEKIQELISAALEDNILTSEERKMIFNKGKSLGIPDTSIEELIAISREKDRNHSELNKIHRIKFETALNDLKHFRIEKSLKNLEMLNDVYPDNKLVKKYFALAKSMTSEFDEILNLKYDDIFKDFTILLYYIKKEDSRRFNKKVIQHNHILFACAQVENELLQCMKSNDFHSLDNLNEVLDEISDWRENEVQNEDEKAYLNFILSLFQMCRDVDEVSAIQNDYIKLVADARFKGFKSTYLQNANQWEFFHIYRIIGYPQFANYIENRKKAKIYLEKRAFVLAELGEFQKKLHNESVVDFSDDKTIESINERYMKFKEVIRSDFSIIETANTIELNNVRDKKWNQLETSDKEQIGLFFQSIKDNYNEAIHRVNTEEENRRLARQNELDNQVLDLLVKVKDFTDNSDFQSAEELCNQISELKPDFDLTEVRGEIQQKIELNVKSSEKEIVSLIRDYLNCFKGDSTVNQSFKKDNEHSRPIRYKLSSAIKDSGVMSSLMGMGKNISKDLESVFYGAIDLNSIILKIAYPNEKMIQIGSQLWFCNNAEKSNIALKDAQLKNAQADSDWNQSNQKMLSAYCNVKSHDNDLILYNGYSVNEFKRILPVGIKVPNFKDASELADLYKKLCVKKAKDSFDKLNKLNIEKYFAHDAQRRDANISFYDTEMHFWLDGYSSKIGFNLFKKSKKGEEQYYFKVNNNHNIVVNKDVANNGMNIRFMGADLSVKEALDLLNNN